MLKSPLAHRLLGWSALGFAGAALGLLLLEPEALLPSGNAAAGRALVHLLTLGLILSGYYALQDALWRRLYGRAPLWPWLTLLVWLLHVTGLTLLAWGFFSSSTFAAHIGGHYLVTTGAALAFAQGVGTAAKRSPASPLHLAAHLPGLGLLVTISLGAMMVLDADGGGYGTYTPLTILIHVSAGAFLFFLPFVLCASGLGGSAVEVSALDSSALEGSALNGPALEDSVLNGSAAGDSAVEGSAGEDPDAAGAGQGPFAASALLLFPVGLGSMGVLALALGGIPEAADLLPSNLWRAVGLGLLGAVALWVGLPALALGKQLTLLSMRRSLWGGLGVLLLFAAIRAGRDEAEGEQIVLMRFSVTLFLFGVAFPEVLALIAARFSTDDAASPGDIVARAAATQRFEAVQLVTLLFMAGLLLVAQMAGQTLLVRVAVLPGLAMLLWQARRMWMGPKN